MRKIKTMAGLLVLACALLTGCGKKEETTTTEVTTTEVTTTEVTTATTTETTTSTSTNTATKTGDATPVAPITVIMLVAAAGITILGVSRKKRNDK